MAYQRDPSIKRRSLKSNEGVELVEIIGKFTEVCRQFYNMALNAMQKKAYLTALSYLEQGLKIDSQNRDLRLLAGLCNYALGDLANANHCWQGLKDSLAERYLEQSGTESGDFPGVSRAYNLGLELMKKGEYLRATHWLERALRKGPQLLPALELLAWAYYSVKKYQKCRKILLRIRNISVDAPVLGELSPEMMRLTRWGRLPYLAAVIVLLIGIFGFINLRLKEDVSREPVSIRTATKQSERPPMDESLLRKTANSLVQQGNYLASADIFYALDGKKKSGFAITPPEELAWSKAAVHYYFLAMQRMKNHADIQADHYFVLSRVYPFRSYVYDDSLYFHAIVKERLRQYPLTERLFKQLLKEQPESNYSLSAVIRWGKLATVQVEMRPEFIAYMGKYPKYQTLVQTLAKHWKDK